MLERTQTDERIAELTARLDEAEEMLRAVRCGEIDAFVVQGPDGDQIYSLRTAEQPYRNLVEQMPEGAAILTTDGDITYCNRRFAELVVAPLESVIGGSMERFVNVCDRPLYHELLDAGTGKRRSRLTAADGRLIDVLMSLTTSECDGIERRHLIITDLSELLDAQNGRDRAEQQSQAKDEFMAMLAHELRNPLSAITAAVQVLDAARGDANASSRARFIIARQVQHLARLVDDLLDVSRVVTGKIILERRTLDLCDLVKRTTAVFAERETTRRFAMSVEPVWVEGDVVRMEQILSNIIGNAVKYTPQGGSIRISLAVEGEEAVLRIQDNGFGISPDLLPRIFDLFVQGEQTLDRAQGGLGIGLTLVKRLVTLHRGTVSADSDGPGKGSLFTLHFPRVRAVGAAAAMTPAPRPGAVRRRVLIVEDNRDAREMFRLMLELDGHQVIEAEDGYAGLRLLRTEADLDVAFIDVGLPGLDGYEVVRRIREEAGSNLRVSLIALTGYGTPEALEHSRRAGFDHHLIKPVNPDTLFKLLGSSERLRGQHGVLPHYGSVSGVKPSHPTPVAKDMSLQ